MRSGLYRRTEAVTTQEMDGELFLASSASGAIYRLNTAASAFWNILEQPCDLSSMIDLFSEAFPDQSRGKLQRDLVELADEMESQGLISRNQA